MHATGGKDATPRGPRGALGGGRGGGSGGSVRGRGPELGRPISGGLFVFLQAEDGIRDVAVTGVQTCALPISPAPLHPTHPWETRREHPPFSPRSEERRVGKEGRSRGSPYHLKKKHVSLE